MNVFSPEPQLATVPEAAAVQNAPISSVEIDRSCQVPVMGLFIASVIWLVIGIVFEIIGSIKLHAPGFLADGPWLTYGRVRPASTNMLVYGFASQAGLAVALWILARLGRNRLQCPLFAFCGVLFWNCGVAIGIVGILAGESTGYELLEFPGYASAMLFVAYAVMGIAAILTFHARREPEVYPSQWYVLASLLWFPWVYSTAELLLVFGSVRGVLQAAVNGWAAHNLFSLWLTPLGLAAIFYFLPKLTNCPLYSRSLAIFGFWLLALFGAFGGLSIGMPVPKWMTSLSVVGTVLILTGVLAVATNWHLTATGRYGTWKLDAVFRFILVAAMSYLAASLLQIVAVLRTVSAVTEFTFYSSGVMQLYLFGFIGMAFSGSIYYIVPRITNAEWPSAGLVAFHFWTAVFGIALVTLPLITGGVVQGLRVNNADVNFLDVVIGTKPFLGMSTLGGVLLLAGTLALLTNLARLAWSSCCGWRRVPTDMALPPQRRRT